METLLIPPRITLHGPPEYFQTMVGRGLAPTESVESG